MSTILVIAAVSLRIISNPMANVFQKKLTGLYQHPLLINLVTYLVLSIGCVVLIAIDGLPYLPAEFWLYSVLSGLAGGVGNGLLVKALQRGELSVLGPINAYKSIVGMIIGLFLLREVPNFWGLTGVALIIYGSYFVLETTPDKFSWALFRRPEIQYRLGAMILTGIEAVLLKKVILLSNTSLAFASWCWFGGIFAFFFCILNKVDLKNALGKINKSHVVLYLLLVLCIAVMQLSTTFSFNHLEVGYALALFQLSLLLSVLLGHHIFKERDLYKKIIGAFIMILGSLLIILLK